MNLIDNLTIYGDQPIDSVMSTPEFLAVKLDESLKEKVKEHGI